MGFSCDPSAIPKLALIGGPDFVNHLDDEGNHVGFFAKKEDIPMLAEISGKGDAWVNHKNSDDHTCLDKNENFW